MCFRRSTSYRWGVLGTCGVGATLSLGACGWRALGAVALPDALPNGSDAQVDFALMDAEVEPDDDAGEGGVDAEPSTLPCRPVGTAIDAWTFDAGVDGWTLLVDPNVQASLTWTSSSGDPAPGALVVEIAPSKDAGTINGGWVQYTAPLGNLSSRTASAWVMLDRGAIPHLKLFVQTGSQYAWADNGTMTLSRETWMCVSLNLQSPAYQQATYDPTDVIRIGFELLGSEPFRLYIGTVEIY
jgi:hypothetical protein